MAAVALFWHTNMGAVTSCENTLYCYNTLLHIFKLKLADDCLDRYSQYGPFFVHIQLAVDHAKNYYSLCSVTL